MGNSVASIIERRGSDGSLVEIEAGEELRRFHLIPDKVNGTSAGEKLPCWKDPKLAPGKRTAQSGSH